MTASPATSMSVADMWMILWVHSSNLRASEFGRPSMVVPMSVGKGMASVS